MLQLYRRGQIATLREQERQFRLAKRRDERERAKQILSDGADPITNVPIPLAEKEQAFYRTPVASLEPLEDGGFRRLNEGELIITNQGAYFTHDHQVVRRHRIQEVERIDVPYVDVIVLITFRDTMTRDEERVYYQMEEPLVAAAHLARYTAFELVLD